MTTLGKDGVFGTAPEQAFDDLTALAALVCDAPIALISLAGDNRLWIKSAHGLALRDLPRDPSFCACVLHQSDLVVVPDATADARFAGMPLVTDAPCIRFYAGVPLVSSGRHVLGTLCVMDVVPRQLTGEQAGALRTLAAQVMAQLELRRQEGAATHWASALRARDSRQAALMNAALDAIILMDHEGRIAEFNPAAAVMFGCAPAEAIGRDLAELIVPPSLREKHRKGLARYLATGEAAVLNRRIEITGQRADGSEFPVELAIARVGQDTPPTFIGFLRDLTARNYADSALRLSKERFELVTRATHDAVWDWDVVAGTLWWNKGFQILFGYARHEIEPGLESWTNRLHPDDYPRVKAGIMRVLEGSGTSWADEYRFARKDGTYADIFDRGYVIRDEIGTAVRMVGVMIDLTARKKAEEDLRTAEERFRQLAENIQQVFWIVGAPSGGVLYISPAYETIWGRTCESLYRSPRAWVEAIHPEDRQRVLEAEARQASGRYDETYRIIRPDGSIRVIQDRAFPIRNADGDVYRIVGTATDVTERRQLEEQLRQSQKMETVGLLAGGIAHDFNNLLTVINGTADLVLAELPQEHALRLELEEIRQAGVRAADLTGQLLALSRQQPQTLEVLNLSDVAGAMRAMLRRLIGEDVELAFNLDPDLGSVEVDPRQIELVVLNLAINARDAMPEGGTLTIATRDAWGSQAEAVPQADLRPGSHVLLVVSDTGLGMDDLTRQRIFEPFFTTKEVGKGTGLGLSTVYGIVQQSGGSIRVESGPGHGSTFTICLPTVDRPSNALQALRHPAPARGTETILLVEDEPGVRRLGCRILRAEGYVVLEADSGEAAVAAAGRHEGPIHLLLTDVVMPGMNGRELATQLGKTRPDTRVLFTSGYTDDAILRHGVLDDRRHFIGKPYTPEELRRRVRELLDSPPT